MLRMQIYGDCEGIKTLVWLERVLQISIRTLEKLKSGTDGNGAPPAFAQ